MKKLKTFILIFSFQPSQDDYLYNIIPSSQLLPWQSFSIEAVQSLFISMVWLSSSELQNKTDKDLASKNFVAVHVGFALLGNTLWAVSTFNA